MSLCAATGCDRPSVARGLCFRHYKRLRRNGTIVARCPDRGVRYSGEEDRYRRLVMAVEDCDTEPGSDQRFDKLLERLRKARSALRRKLSGG